MSTQESARQAALLLRPAAGPGRRDLHRDRAARRLRADRPAGQRATRRSRRPSVQVTRHLPRRHRRRRGPGGRGADRAAALRARRAALLPVVQLQRRGDEPAGVLRHRPGPGPRRGGRAERRSSWPSRSCRRRCAARGRDHRRRRPTSCWWRRSPAPIPRYDATYLTNYAKLYVVDELKRLTGVGDATVFGGLDFSMTDPARPRPHGPARHHGGRRARRGAGAERHQSRRHGSAGSRRRRAPSSPCR